MPPTPTCSRSFSTFSRSFSTFFGAKLCQNAFQTIPVNSIFGEKHFFSTICFRVGHRFSSFWASFGASTGKRTSPSTSPQFFALDAAIMRSVRPKIDEKLAVGACTGVGGRGWVGGQVLILDSSNAFRSLPPSHPLHKTHIRAGGKQQ